MIGVYSKNVAEH